jgi:hypothetical protein
MRKNHALVPVTMTKQLYFRRHAEEEPCNASTHRSSSSLLGQRRNNSSFKSVENITKLSQTRWIPDYQQIDAIRRSLNVFIFSINDKPLDPHPQTTTLIIEVRLKIGILLRRETTQDDVASSGYGRPSSSCYGRHDRQREGVVDRNSCFGQ